MESAFTQVLYLNVGIFQLEMLYVFILDIG